MGPPGPAAITIREGAVECWLLFAARSVVSSAARWALSFLQTDSSGRLTVAEPAVLAVRNRLDIGVEEAHALRLPPELGQLRRRRPLVHVGLHELLHELFYPHTGVHLKGPWCS